ncbi:MAG: thiamine-monophosphate kinase [Chthoniobacterales bacterium]|nr:thiamine-monophosphate kinase [Chthoniobacterales bacterium]
MNLRESAKGRIRCGELGEDRLISALVASLKAHPGVIAGPGDDCAVVDGAGAGELLLLKTDCVVEGVHFLPNEKPTAIGWKAMARTLSDFAAMSGRPRYALITLVAPREREARWTLELYRGLRSVADRFSVAIVGGETSSTAGPVVISISATGTVEKERWVSRAGGEAGDALFVTGKLGGSIRRKHLNFLPRIEESRWLTKHFRLHAMMDLSDGLGADLPRLAQASGVGFEIDERALPRTRGCSIAQAINDGEDYELLFALSPNDAAKLAVQWRKKFPQLPLTRIGHFTASSESAPPPSFHGFLHFS